MIVKCTTLDSFILVGDMISVRVYFVTHGKCVRIFNHDKCVRIFNHDGVSTHTQATLLSSSIHQTLNQTLTLKYYVNIFYTMGSDLTTS